MSPAKPDSQCNIAEGLSKPSDTEFFRRFKVIRPFCSLTLFNGKISPSFLHYPQMAVPLPIYHTKIVLSLSYPQLQLHRPFSAAPPWQTGSLGSRCGFWAFSFFVFLPSPHTASFVSRTFATPLRLSCPIFEGSHFFPTLLNKPSPFGPSETRVSAGWSSSHR